jgi:myo-inositol 2-dehydrogenase / D-chiro-inositol 1-dehydrogenase
VRSVQGKTKAEPSGEDGLLALALAEAALKSVAEGRMVKMTEVAGEGRGMALSRPAK